MLYTVKSCEGPPLDNPHSLQRITMILKIHLQNPEPRTIRKAAEILAAGGIVIYPTDTVYGLGCSI
jgi:hypothetical protein